MSHVLIVEDEERIAAFVDKGLRANGFTTAIAPTGEHALQTLLSESFDLVINLPRPPRPAVGARAGG